MVVVKSVHRFTFNCTDCTSGSDAWDYRSSKPGSWTLVLCNISYVGLPWMVRWGTDH